MCVDKYEPAVPLERHLETVIDLRFDAMEKAVIEARRVMEERMAGFPLDYAKKSELEQTAVTLKDLKDRDLRELKDEIEKRMSRSEYDVQHGIISTKITDQEKRVQGVELLKADITGRIWTLGIVLSILVIALEFVIKFVLKG